MPAKKTSKQPTKKNRPGVLQKFKNYAVGKGAPLLAIIVVLGVVGLGYYGYLRSSADTLSNTPPTVHCGSNVSAKECKKKQADSDAAFYAELQQNCAAAHRIYSDNSCGNCRVGYYDKDGVCKERQTVDCAAQGRFQENEWRCGACKSGTEVNGVCKSEPSTTSNPQAVCLAKHRAYNVQTQQCGDCLSGYQVLNGACVVSASAPSPQAVCLAKHRAYNTQTEQCGSCLSGFQELNGACVVSPGTPTPTNDPVSLASECASQHKAYITTSNACGNCLSGYVSVGDGCYTTAQARAVCAGQYRSFNERTKKCGGCVANYTEVNGVCQKQLTPPENCALTGNCPTQLTPDAVRKICEYTNRRYNASNNRCGSCLNGYYENQNDHFCHPISTTPPADVKATCDKQQLIYDKDSNSCLNKCKATYVMQNGACVKWESAGMNKWRCEALGRIWVPSSEDGQQTDNPRRDTDGICKTGCPTTYGSLLTWIDTGDPDTSYCKLNDGANMNSGVGVSTNMTKEECQAQHRVWIGALNGCTAKCQNGWYVDNNVCKQVQTDNNNGTNVGDGGDGGCSQPNQGVPTHFAQRGTDTATMNVCPDDDTTLPPTDTPPAQPVKQTVEYNIDLATCHLLGRSWVPDTKDAQGDTVKGGCSTQQCLNKDFEVRRANGSFYCEGSVDRISVEDCTAAHREWIPEVKACAARVAVAGKTKVDAKQCEAPYTVYVHHNLAEGNVDECVKPSTLQKLQSVATKTGKPVAYLASLAPQTLCKLQPNRQWVDDSCVKSREATVSTAVSLTDSFGNAYDTSYKFERHTCKDLVYKLTVDQKATLDCIKSNAQCLETGGKPEVVYLAMAQNKLWGTTVCNTGA